MTEGELLGQRAAERHAEHVDHVVAEHVEEPRDDARQSAHSRRAARPVGFAGAGCVEGDHVAPVQLSLERPPHVEVRPDAHDEQQRRAVPGTLRHAHPEAVDVDRVGRPAWAGAGIGLDRVGHGGEPSGRVGAQALASPHQPIEFLTPSDEPLRARGFNRCHGYE